MDIADREADPQFSQPFRQITLMLFVSGLVGLGVYYVFPAVEPVIMANPYLNGLIAGVFVVGVLACFGQVFQLISAVGWIEGFALDRPGHEFRRAPRLLASLAALLRSRSSRLQIGASSSRSILDSVATRMDESRDITRYITSLLIFLGLLGTFYGLATTVPALVQTIQSLDSTGGANVFDSLQKGLENQLGGMGTAFASSLLGLAGSLIVGLLDLFAGHGQNRFYRELEEWLSTITRVGLHSGDVEIGGGDSGAALVAVDQITQQMESLQNMFVQSDVNRSLTDERLNGVAGAVEKLAEKLDGAAAAAAGQPAADPQIAQQQFRVMRKIAEGQERLIQVIEKQGSEEHVDAESRMRLRSIDVQLLRILEELSAGRQDTVAELRSDLAELNRTLREAAGTDETNPPRRRA